MNNYLVYPDCFTEERINGCRFALLKALALYNLTPPANMGVIVYTNKPALFEIFLSFFKHMHVIEAKPSAKKYSALPNEIASKHEGKLLLCQTHCYPKAPVETLFRQLANEGAGLHNAHSSCVQTVQSEVAPQHSTTPLPAADYFVNYKDVKEMVPLLKTFFARNEEESLPNLVKKTHVLDANTVRSEAAGAQKAPLLQKWLNNLLGRNPVLQRYQKKL